MWACAPVHRGSHPLLLEGYGPRGKGVWARLKAQCAEGKSPALLPSLPSALGGQTLPEALGGDLNILYSRPQAVGVGGKKGGAIQEGFPVQQRPPPRDPQAAAISSCLRNRTRPTGTLRSRPLHDRRPPPGHCAWKPLIHFFRTRACVREIPHKYPSPRFDSGTLVPRPRGLKERDNSGQTTNPAPTATCRRVVNSRPGSGREGCKG